MQSSNGFKKNLVFFAVLSVCISQPAFAGSIVGWGGNDYGQATPPDSNDFVAIAAGRRHSLALKSDGEKM